LANPGAMVPPCTPPGAGGGQHPCFHAPSPEPFPHETHYPPVMPAVAQRFSQSSPGKAIAVSTHIGIHDPPHPLLHAPLASLRQGRVGAASWPKAIRASVAVWLVERFQQHGHRSRDTLLLERWRPNPDALDGRGLRAAAASALVQVVPMLVQVFGIRLGRHPIAPGGTRLTRVLVRFPHKGCIA
jgi:hypothetical protein